MQVIMSTKLIYYLALGLLFSASVIAKSDRFLRYSDSTKSSSDSFRSFQIEIDGSFDNEQTIGRAIANLPSENSKPSARLGFNRRVRKAYDIPSAMAKKTINIFTIPDFTTVAQIRYVGKNSQVLYKFYFNLFQYLNLSTNVAL